MQHQIEIEETLSKLFQLLEIQAAFEITEITPTPEGERQAYRVDIKTDNPGILIGYKGETLQAIESICAMIINNGLDDRIRLELDIDNWRAQRETKLSELLERTIQQVDYTNTRVHLPPLPASERRYLHSLLNNYPGFTSESQGRGPDRHLVVSKAPLPEEQAETEQQ
jgi:spoIIIJ-associated protein